MRWARSASWRPASPSSPLALAACALTSDLDTLFALRMLAGGSAGGVVPLALALMGDRIPIERRQVAIGRFLVAVILGQLSGSTFAGLIEGAIGWAGVFAITAGVAALGCAAALLGFDRSAAAPARRPDFRTAMARYRTIVANPRARILFGAVFIEAIAVFGIFPHLAPLIEARGEGGAREAGLALAGFAAGGLIYAFSVGLLLRFLGMSRMLIGGGLICAGALVTIGLAGTWQLDCAALVAMGLGFYMLHNTFQVAGDRGGADRAGLGGGAARLLVLLRTGARRGDPRRRAPGPRPADCPQPLRRGHRRPRIHHRPAAGDDTVAVTSSPFKTCRIRGCP